MKNLLGKLDSAYAAKQQVINSHGSYYYTASVPYKHKFKTGLFKITWKTETRYRDETRFNQVTYNRALTEADHEIEKCKV